MLDKLLCVAMAWAGLALNPALSKRAATGSVEGSRSSGRVGLGAMGGLTKLGLGRAKKGLERRLGGALRGRR